MITKFHAKYYAHEITREGGKGIDRLSRSIFDACVDINPHQIEAALFALKSPLTKGVLFADEVGLGKTIEAGLVMSQLWAERKRKLIVISPASLRKQWEIELSEKFNIPSTVIDAKSYRLAVDEGMTNPFDRKDVVIVSTHFTSRYKEEIKRIGWDLAIVDEAHKLRNAYRPSNKMGKNIRWALEDCKKLLLTATPLQNSLLELFGLSTIIDERIFGDRDSFRSLYMNAGGNLSELRERLQYFSNRTLRRQVAEFIQFTERKLITRPFKPSDDEHKLYVAVTDYLHRDGNYAMPPQHKHLTSLIVRKLLASSSRAVAGTFETMRDRLKILKENIDSPSKYAPTLFAGEEGFDEELFEELMEIAMELEEEQEIDDNLKKPQVADNKTEKIDLIKLDQEIDELDRLFRWASSIGTDSKSKALLKALEVGFSQIEKMQAAQKAIIFTESRRTQNFLFDYLEANGYAGKVITFNGTNREPHTTELYNNWRDENQETGRVSGSRPVDVRTAIIENFRDHAQIMVATEAAAEGINLQFCSLVINYDLPWNPQRIEQRIGRCHRYGQKFDVVVINFLNQRNEVDQRVYELLKEKFKLFSGVFGASDEVLGSIESGVDFERRILDIYDQCRTPEQIEAAFNALRAEMDEKITTKMAATRKKLLENFDDDVHQMLKANLHGTRETLDAFSRMFWNLTKYMLAGKASFDDLNLTFVLDQPPIDQSRPGHYRLISKDHQNVIGEYLYRLSHPLG
ncbi:MAG: DEAD/DEAH box helicase family protein, partial [Chloroflexi bacterium]|nr:DEAD/DEAH box helicase family protein [Chloroflexota bacterium]